MVSSDNDKARTNLEQTSPQKRFTRRAFLAGGAAVSTSSLFFGASSVLAAAKRLAPTKAATGVATRNWAALQAAIKGQVVTPAAGDFATVTSDMVWNALKPDRSPDVIVKCQDVNDVIAAVNFARNNQLKIAVHGGGHSWCGTAIRNGGMTIDLSAMTKSEIDSKAGTAWMEPVISNREGISRLSSEGFAFPVGHCPPVKMSGYLLNGGLSWNLAAWGPGCKSVESIDFVTADGKLINANAKEHTDLYWAARGCGPGMFAVATRYHLKLFPLPKAITCSVLYFPLEDLKEVVQEVTRVAWNLPEIVELSIFMLKAPAQLADKCKASNGKVLMITANAFANTKEEGQAALKLLNEAPIVSKALSSQISFQSTFDGLFDASGALWPEGHRNKCENQTSNASPADYMLALRDDFINAPSDKSVIVFCQSTGAHKLLRPDPNMALSLDASSYGGFWTIWENAKDDQANIAWHNKMLSIMKPFTDKHYIGETDIVDDPSFVQNSFSENKWQRLEKIRAKYDPDGLFFGFFGGLSATNKS